MKGIETFEPGELLITKREVQSETCTQSNYVIGFNASVFLISVDASCASRDRLLLLHTGLLCVAEFGRISVGKRGWGGPSYCYYLRRA